MKKLTAKQEMFCREYLIDLNATQAAIRAGYSEKTAQAQSSRMLSNVMVQARISELKSERIEEVKIDANYVLNRLVEIDQMDFADIVNDDGSLKPVKIWPKVWRTYLSGFDVSELWEGVGEDRVQVGLLKKIKWPDKVKNLELLGKHVDVKAFDNTVKHEITASELSDEQIEEELKRLEEM